MVHYDMFIRWQSRKRRRPAFGHWERPKQDVHWKAVLAESARVNGKPLQRHLAVLGGITDSAIEITAQRCHFWDGVIERLERLGNQITADDRQRIEVQVANKVPRPTPDEYKAEARRSAQMWGWKYLTEPQRAALQDEAAQWRNGQGQLVTELQSLRGAATSPPACSFCGKTADQVETMVASNGAYICNECVERAISAIAERKARSAP
jgi:hypothetical protein